MLEIVIVRFFGDEFARELIQKQKLSMFMAECPLEISRHLLINENYGKHYAIYFGDIEGVTGYQF